MSQRALQESHPLVTLILGFYEPLTLILFVLAVVQNVLILEAYSSDDFGRSGTHSQLGMRTSPLIGTDQGTGLALDRSSSALASIGTMILVISVLLCLMHAKQQ